jgi:hypothetical protein
MKEEVIHSDISLLNKMGFEWVSISVLSVKGLTGSK